MFDSFSQRQGFAGPPAGVLIRDEVPVSFRTFLIDLPHSFSGLELHEMRKVVCAVLQKYPDGNLPPYYESKELIQECEWFHIYDIIEGLYQFLQEKHRLSYDSYASRFAKTINEALIAQNLGWKLHHDGHVVARGDERFEHTLTIAAMELRTSHRPTTANEIDEALLALSRRPEPNFRGAIFHGMGALECLVRDLTDEPKLTLGDALKKHPQLVPKPLDDALGKLWGYASNEARHVTEGREPKREEAELIVVLAASLVTYLSRKNRP